MKCLQGSLCWIRQDPVSFEAYEDRVLDRPELTSCVAPFTECCNIAAVAWDLGDGNIVSTNSSGASAGARSWCSPHFVAASGNQARLDVVLCSVKRHHNRREAALDWTEIN
ncbi:hypothetical protein chiPu_0009982 [Chiloscyllium punctatum]|uniref:Uncharacterized protein n=1 Tax=Chiloscyllium punctatum TaxID=137246 RepID=A0A401SMB9_CHIPU|nr:hypothetical protein [Chiloscyllium punctatum]